MVDESKGMAVERKLLERREMRVLPLSVGMSLKDEERTVNIVTNVIMLCTVLMW